MKNSKNILYITLAILVSVAVFSGCADKNRSEASKAEVDSLRNIVNELMTRNQNIARNLQNFDTLDYTVFSKQQWERLHESHAPDVLVHWPDGHKTKGLEKHIEDLKSMFVYAPNTSIKQHPIKIGNHSMTAVVGRMTGTFSAPMPIGNGKTIPPTGKSFDLTMCTVGLWNGNGTMREEFLFWDNATFMKQIGLAK
jgi:hypothetical protein